MKYNYTGYNIQLVVLALIGGIALMWNIHLLSGWQQHIPLIQYCAFALFAVVFLSKEDMKRFVKELENKKGDEQYEQSNNKIE